MSKFLNYPSLASVATTLMLLASSAVASNGAASEEQLYNVEVRAFPEDAEVEIIEGGFFGATVSRITEPETLSLPAGDYRYVATSPGYETLRRDFTVSDDTDVLITLTPEPDLPLYPITFSLAPDSDEVIADMLIEVSKQGLFGEKIGVYRGEDIELYLLEGRYSYKASVAEDGYKVTRGNIEVPADTTEEVTIEDDLPDNAKRVFARTYGSEWPLTVDDGVLRCESGLRLVFEWEGETYALNGLAGSDYQPLNSLWDDNPSVSGLKKDLSPLIDDAMELCDS